MGRPKCGTELVFHLKGLDILTRVARRVNPEAIVWRGDTALPRSQQGVKVLGVPVGQREFVLNFLERKTERTFCSVPTHPGGGGSTGGMVVAVDVRFQGELLPDLTEAFAHRHDDNVCECLRQILQSLQIMMWPESHLHFHLLWVVRDSLQEAGRGRALTGQVGLIASLWSTVARADSPEPSEPKFGWQHKATRCASAVPRHRMLARTVRS